MNLLNFEEALQQLLAQARAVPKCEALPLHEVSGRYLAQPVTSPLDIPQEDRAIMDGYALKASDVTSQPVPISQRIAAGQVATPLLAGTAARIFTGAPIPSGADCVVMQEDCREVAQHVHIHAVPHAGQWIRSRGSDVQKASIALPQGVRLGAAQIGLAAMMGLDMLPVHARLKVGLFSTGNELVAPGQPLPPAAAYDANRFVLFNLLDHAAWEVVDLGHLPDQRAVMQQRLHTAGQSCDVIITTGGVSVGEEDHVRASIEAEGHLNLWRLAVKPGRPLAFGQIGQAAIFALPGNPVAAYVTCLMLVLPYLRASSGAQLCTIAPMPLVADFEWTTPDRKRREFLRVRRQGHALSLHPCQNSSVLSSCAWADGLVNNPPAQKIKVGDKVDYLSFNELILGPW